MKITWFTTASVKIETEKASIVFDPFLKLLPEKMKNEAYFDFVKKAKDAYLSSDAIFISHPHLDHIYNVPQLNQCNENIPIYCGTFTRASLERKGVKPASIKTISYGDVIQVGDIKIEALKGKHIDFDFQLILKTGLNHHTFKYRKHGLFLLGLNKEYPMNDEIFAYLITVENKRILMLGSLNEDPDYPLPQGVDIFLMPFQGNSRITSIAKKMIKEIRPKLTVVIHHDDSFPPISRWICPRRLKKYFKGRYSIKEPVSLETFIPRV